jgi:hypothetical protein
MSSSQSALAASLINQIACNNVACPNLMENEALRKKTLSLAKKLVLALERPQAVPLNSILVTSPALSNILFNPVVTVDILSTIACPKHRRKNFSRLGIIRPLSKW